MVAKENGSNEVSEVKSSPERTTPSVKWNDSDMRTTYANVVNATSTREEVTLFFGTNLTWNPNDAKDFKVQLSDRIILTPFAAKRLNAILARNLAEYENRYGALKLPVSRERQERQA
ncbi:MAG: DUF3467 domain-containing protein [bacterium]